MLFSSIQSEGEGLFYIIDCTLATVERMAQKKRRPVHEYTRQKSIASKGISLLLRLKVPIEVGSRVWEVINVYEGSVDYWAKFYENN